MRVQRVVGPQTFLSHQTWSSLQKVGTVKGKSKSKKSLLFMDQDLMLVVSGAFKLCRSQ